MKIFLLVLLFLFGFCTQAYGWSGTASSDPEYLGDRTFNQDSTNCKYCHPKGFHTNGPHGNYSNSTSLCSTCHTVHNSPSSKSLLRVDVDTATELCQYCHDLTQSKYAPYAFYDDGATEPQVYAAHRVKGIKLPNDYTNAAGEMVLGGLDYGSFIIPGGSAIDGGIGYFVGQNQGRMTGTLLGCFSCHAVHAISGTMVKPYLGESQLKVAIGEPQTNQDKIYLTNRLLRNRPNPVGDYVYDYGSKWCLTCHTGRISNLTMVNHPVNEAAEGYDLLNALPEQNFIFQEGKAAAIEDVERKKYVLIEDGLLSNSEKVHINTDPRSNSWFAMVSEDAISSTERPDGNVDFKPGGPACQQCHGNPRDVELAFSVVTGSRNPFRMSFPHVSGNQNLLIELDDDLCTNCHGRVNLP